MFKDSMMPRDNVIYYINRLQYYQLENCKFGNLNNIKSF